MLGRLSKSWTYGSYRTSLPFNFCSSEVKLWEPQSSEMKISYTEVTVDQAPRLHLHATRSGDESLRHFAEKIRQVKSDDFIPAKLHRPQSESMQVNVQAVTHLDRRREKF